MSDPRAKLKNKRAAHDSGKRTADPIWIILHSTEGNTAAGAASWFANEASAGSTQIVVDAKEGFRCVPDDVIAWGASGANALGLHCEFAAYAAWKRLQWLRKGYRDALKRGAYQVAKWSLKYDIPVEYLDATDLVEQVPGISFHYVVQQAFPSSGHSDPGPFFPKRTFARMVRKYRRELQARRG